MACTPTGMPILWALANPKLDEREVLQAMLDVEEDLIACRPGLLLIADKGFAAKERTTWPCTGSNCCGRRSSGRRSARASLSSKSVRQMIESVNDTLKGQLDLEQHGGRTFEGVAVRVAQRVLAMAVAFDH
ncbi:hypothetical protein GCM10010294_46950 [Streptomyces griseoloalbus]|nr:hypothetical protein GCM10010294_46950 [Streptomyces griseoloalbus]